MRGALLELMVEFGWDDIDVQSLCERTNIGRSTFYLHYPNKEELLKGSFSDLRAALLAQTSVVAKPSEPLAFVRGLLDHVYQEQAVFRALLGRRSGHFVQDRFRELLLDWVTADRATPAKPSWQEQATMHYLAGALFQTMVWWLSTPRAQKPDQVELHFQALSQGVVARHSGIS